MTPPLPDLLRERDGRHPFWLRAVFLVSAAGLVFLGLASDRTRRFINRMERKLSENTRRRIRRVIAMVPGRWVRNLVNIPEGAV